MSEQQPEAPARLLAESGWVEMTPEAPAVPAVEDLRAAAALADADRMDSAAAILEHRYPAARPAQLGTVITELRSIARAWRRMAAPLVMPPDEFEATRKVAERMGLASPVPVPAGPGAAATEPPPALPVAADLDLEPLGRLVRETWVEWAAEQPDPKPSWLTGWDELDGAQRDVDMRIGHAVANYALTENAATYGISCADCAAHLDRANAERERAERAEAKLAAIEALCRHVAVSAWGGATPIVAAERILAIVSGGTKAGRG